MMSEIDLTAMIKLINQFIQGKAWFDFDVTEFSPFRVTVSGGLDLSSGEADVEISFEDVFCVSTLMSWRSDTSKAVLRVLDGERERAVIERFQVEEGYQSFEFVAERYPDSFGCLIVAKRISWRTA